MKKMGWPDKVTRREKLEQRSNTYVRKKRREPAGLTASEFLNSTLHIYGDARLVVAAFSLLPAFIGENRSACR